MFSRHSSWIPLTFLVSASFWYFIRILLTARARLCASVETFISPRSGRKQLFAIKYARFYSYLSAVCDEDDEDEDANDETTDVIMLLSEFNDLSKDLILQMEWLIDVLEHKIIAYRLRFATENIKVIGTQSLTTRAGLPTILVFFWIVQKF